MIKTPSISVEYDYEMDEHVLMAYSYGRNEVAGPRLFRAPPHPDIKFRHTDKNDAFKDADKLRTYLQGLGKGPSKSKLRKIVEEEPAKPVIKDAVWM